MDIQWTKLDAWHIIDSTFISRASRYFVLTRCGLEREWDQTFVDRLPGGGEESCENCLRLLARSVDEPEEEVKPKRSRKKTE